jgi:hypothetical protein
MESRDLKIGKAGREFMFPCLSLFEDKGTVL